MAGVRHLTDHVAIVTASTKGIGLAIARRLGLDGAKVVVSSRKEENVREAVKALQMDGIECAGCIAHVGLSADRKKLVDFTIQHFNKLDILVSNAAVNPHYGDLMSVSDSQWDKLLNINVSRGGLISIVLKQVVRIFKVKSAFRLTQEALPYLEQSEKASIIFVSSIAGYAPVDGIGAYSVMKAALNGITKSLSQSLSRRNIRVNAIAPGSF